MSIHCIRSTLIAPFEKQHWLKATGAGETFFNEKEGAIPHDYPNARNASSSQSPYMKLSIIQPCWCCSSNRQTTDVAEAMCSKNCT